MLSRLWLITRNRCSQKSVKNLTKFFTQDNVAGDFSHYIYFQAIFPPFLAITSCTFSPSSMVRQNGIISLTLVSPISSRTTRIASHSRANPQAYPTLRVTPVFLLFRRQFCFQFPHLMIPVFFMLVLKYLHIIKK